MPSMILLFALVVVGTVLSFVILRRRSRTKASGPLDWLDEFSAADYQPMERLLDNQDYKFLAAQPGYHRSIARRLRRQRIGIFQSYLGGMIRDFHRLLAAARYIMVYSTEDQSSFAESLWRLRLRFYGSVLTVETRVILHLAGLGKVDARGLLSTLGRVESFTHQLIPRFEAV